MTNNLAPASVWILQKYRELEKQLDDNLQTYELAHCVDALYTFLWDYYADWYVEYLKTDSTQVAFAKDLFRQFVVTLHPYAPFETEALWKDFYGEEELLAWVSRDEAWSSLQWDKISNPDAAVDEFALIVEFVQKMRSIRGLFGIQPGNILQILTTDKRLLEYASFSRLMAKTDLQTGQNPHWYQVEISGASYSLNILEFITDTQAEIARTQKLIQNLETQISALNNNLANPKFLERAGGDAIAEKRQNLADRTTEKQQQFEKLDYLEKSKIG